MNFASKLTLYDFLTMFVPGSLWLCIFPCSLMTNMMDYCEKSECSFLILLFFFVAAYLLGLIWHKINEDLLCRIPKLNMSKIKLLPKWLIKCFERIFRSFDRNSPKLIAEAYEDVMNSSHIKDVCKDAEKCRSRKYYFAYYYLQEKNSLGNIPILEAQEAFLRDIYIPAITFYMLAVCCNSGLPYELFNKRLHLVSDCCVMNWVIIISLALGMLIIHAVIQHKIYKLIWEGAHYMSRLEYMRAKPMDMRDPCICDNLSVCCRKKQPTANGYNGCPCKNLNKCSGCPFLKTTP